MIDIYACNSAISPIQGIEYRHRRHLHFRDELLEHTHGNLAQQTCMPISLPGIRLLQRTLLPSLQSIRITHTFAISESMLIIKQQGIINLFNLAIDISGQRGSQQFSERQSGLVCDHIRVCYT